VTREKLKDILKLAAEKGEDQYYETTPPDFADKSIKYQMIVDLQLAAIEASGAVVVPRDVLSDVARELWYCAQQAGADWKDESWVKKSMPGQAYTKANEILKLSASPLAKEPGNG
jgi:hypothetical protein